ncbi:hypothetical protein GCM10011529_17110 [Polymorphobacter glacialis]|uniref:Uncharacterized protein n=1 Tax=Sandarakinorhabdus glacialis TaxID=1614636 RepID=A0A917E7P8_9SPHN|nr:hypothetical protein GCM10011529_17110 [Polymorphobacter glacialis]
MPLTAPRRCRPRPCAAQLALHPALDNGTAIEANRDITINFRLADA